MLSEICTFHCCERSGLPNPKSDGAWSDKQEKLRITEMDACTIIFSPMQAGSMGQGDSGTTTTLSLWSLEMAQEEP